MLIVISPAKTLDYESSVPSRKFSQPQFIEESEKLIKVLRRKAPDDIQDLMHISSKLAELNLSRYLNWERPFSPKNARPAIFAFKGDVYAGLEVQQYKAADLDFAQEHLRILSGLYGVLRPLDLIQPYRLEMGIKLKNSRGDSLYDFWGEQLGASIVEALEGQKDNLLINLASNEYFKAIQGKIRGAEIITPIFKDYKNGQYKVISFFAKKARGLMSSYIIKNRVTNIAGLVLFQDEGYRFSKKDSVGKELVFLRKQS
ncbi:MAG: peroxide stress protein YaaA [Pseudohongiellaceae bacterium]